MSESSLDEIMGRIQEHLGTGDKSDVIRFMSDTVDKQILLESQDEEDWSSILEEKNER